MNLIKAGRIALRFMRRNSPIIISAVAGIGLAALYFLTIKETEEAVQEINEATEEEVHSFKMAKKLAKIFAPSFLVLVFTMFCIAASTVISQHRIRDLTNYSAMLAATFSEYRKRNIELHGAEEDHQIMRQVSTEQIKDEPLPDYENGVLCQIAGYPHYFIVPTKEDLYHAFNEANHYMDTGWGSVELLQWMQWAKAREYDIHGQIVHMDTRYIGYGWETHDLTESEGISWLYPELIKTDIDSGLEVCFIDVPLPKPLDIAWNYAI